MASRTTVSGPVEEPRLAVLDLADGGSAAAPAAPGWVSAHVFYSDDLDPLLVQVVDPLVRELAAEELAGGYFFVRYWDGGPHLRLRCRATADHRAEVERRIVDRVGRFVSERPATREVDEAAYRAQAATLARGEGVPDHRTRPFPTNSLAFLPYRREHDRYGYGAAMAAVESHFGRSSEIVLGLLVAGLPPADRVTAALAMVLLAWFGACVDPDRAGRMAAWLAAHGAGVDPARYRRQREPLHRLAGRMQALSARSGDPAGGGGPAGGGDLLAWARSVRSLHDTLVDTLDRTAYRTPFRVVDTCAHLACNRLGVGVDEERRLRYLAARTIAELGPARAA